MKFKEKAKYKFILTLKIKMTLKIKPTVLFRKKFDFACKIIVDSHGSPYSSLSSSKCIGSCSRNSPSSLAFLVYGTSLMNSLEMPKDARLALV